MDVVARIAVDRESATRLKRPRFTHILRYVKPEIEEQISLCLLLHVHSFVV